MLAPVQSAPQKHFFEAPCNIRHATMKAAAIFGFLLLRVLTIQAQSDEENDVSIVDAGFDGTKMDHSSLDNSEDNGSLECGPFEVYSQCDGNPVCQRTCETLGLDGIPCPRGEGARSCIEGCVCREDYVRSDYRGPCVHNNRCPRVKH